METGISQVVDLCDVPTIDPAMLAIQSSNSQPASSVPVEQDIEALRRVDDNKNESYKLVRIP